MVLHYVYPGSEHGHEQRSDERSITQRRDTWMIEETGRDHERGAPAGWMRASIWKFSLGPEAERVVGAKKVALVNCPDCSIKPIKDGASCVTPMS